MTMRRCTAGSQSAPNEQAVNAISGSDLFRLGVNYWPARTAMSWWSQFDRTEVKRDFGRIAASGLDSVRVFLTWEDFQPAPSRIDRRMLDRLVQVADLAGESGLTLIPTLFTGHMSGVNWIPAWALGGSDGDDRFRVVAGGRVTDAGLRNWFTDPVVGEAQALLAAETVGALRGHDALWAWDLGNENSNCVIPPTRESAELWLARTVAAVRQADDEALVTIGLHMEDLEEDRRLGPREAAGPCDFLSMHGYPIYASWAEGSVDAQLLPFLARVTRWLGNGRHVLFSEFGLPTHRGAGAAQDTRLVDEDAAAAYTAAALEALRDAGCLGAMLWCYSDYAETRWSGPPLDQAPHERSFGLWRADGSPKPSVAAIAAFAGATRSDAKNDDSWIDIGREDFLLDPRRQLPRLYGRYRSRPA
jgi:endo-1,4-beta-mannosidase